MPPFAATMRASRSIAVTGTWRCNRMPGRRHRSGSPRSRSSGSRSLKNEVNATRSYGGRDSSPNTSMSQVSVAPRASSASTSRWATIPAPTTTSFCFSAMDPTVGARDFAAGCHMLPRGNRLLTVFSCRCEDVSAGGSLSRSQSTDTADQRGAAAASGRRQRRLGELLDAGRAGLPGRDERTLRDAVAPAHRGAGRHRRRVDGASVTDPADAPSNRCSGSDGIMPGPVELGAQVRGDVRGADAGDADEGVVADDHLEVAASPRDRAGRRRDRGSPTTTPAGPS